MTHSNNNRRNNIHTNCIIPKKTPFRFNHNNNNDITNIQYDTSDEYYKSIKLNQLPIPSSLNHNEIKNILQTKPVIIYHTNPDNIKTFSILFTKISSPPPKPTVNIMNNNTDYYYELYPKRPSSPITISPPMRLHKSPRSISSPISNDSPPRYHVYKPWKYKNKYKIHNKSINRINHHQDQIYQINQAIIHHININHHHTIATRDTMIPTINSTKSTHDTIQHHTHTVVVIQAQFADAELGESVRKKTKEK